MATSLPSSHGPQAAAGAVRARRASLVGQLGPAWALPAVLFLLGFFVLPLAGNVARGFTSPDGAFTLAYYAKLFTDAYYSGIVVETFVVSIISTVACLIVGYPVAYFIVRHAGRWNPLIVFCLIGPLLTSIIMRTFGWTVLFARKGLFNNWFMQLGLIDKPLRIIDSELMVYVGLVHVLVPFMVLSIAAVLKGVDRRLEESAQILGATPLQAFFRITLPLSMDGIATGCILVFVLTNGSFLTMLLLGGGKVNTLSLLIYQQFTLTQDMSFASAMGNVLLFCSVIALVLQLRYVRRRTVSA
ncbi:ABC transporter permease [Bordetella genomosp. 10]|uniref:ABC transporter permease n=2 Tax=Bordetella genomosp. 10 TaxID=1416804 RepID=A0A261SN56_9BORD|nr:ABC transporter permease [Bordetella genomosp. 10]